MKFWTEKRIVWGMILLYIIFFSVFTATSHYNFQTQTWDMAAFVQTFWHTVNGRVMFNNMEEIPNHLGIHMSPWLFALMPGYALFPSPYYLLIIQTIALGLGAWPLYLLAKKILPDKFPLILTAGYLLYPSLHWLNLFDFHSVAFLPPLLLAAFYFIYVKNWLWSGIFLVLAASTKEDAILIVLFVGLYLFIKKGVETKWWNTQRKFGLAVALISIFYFLISTQVIMPALGGGLLRLDRYANLGNTPVEIVQNVIKEPSLIFKTVFNAAKFRYGFWLFLPTAFLPLLSGSALILLIPGLIENFLTTYGFQFASFYQYDSVLIAGVFMAAIYGLKRFVDRWPNKVKQLKWILIFTIFLGYFMRSPINPIFFPVDLFKSNPQWEAYRQMVRMVPPEATVAANTHLVPHLSHRDHAYMLGAEPFPVDIVLIDSADTFGFTNDAAFQAYVDNYVNSGQYQATVIEDRYIILSKKNVLQ